MFKVMILTTIISITPAVVSATIVHVPADQPTIQAGIDAAVDGDTVLVADGMYTGDGNRDSDFKGKAITVTSENGAETCIIDCQGSEKENHRGFYFHTSETEDTILQGFTIKGAFHVAGSSIRCCRSSPTVSNCNFEDDESTYVFNAGISYGECSNVTISNCRFIRNRGISYSDCSNATISNCTFFRNKGVVYGSSINADSSDLTISNCTFSENSGHLGGAIRFTYCQSLTLVNCNFNDNTADYCGGAIDSLYSDLTITNCTFTGNRAEEWGGGIFSQYSPTTITNCSFTKNSAVVGGAIRSYRSPSLITNSILWEDFPSEIYLEEYSHTVLHSLVQGGYPGIGNIDADPLFIGGDPFNFHLLPDSPCVDTGTTEGSPTTDMDGNPRPNGAEVDIGADEFYWPSISTTFISMPSRSIKADDPASCSVSVWNAGTSTLSGYSLFTILDVFGSYYFAPSFSDFDYFRWSFPPGLTELTILPEFTWPDNVGSESGIVWYAFLMNPDMTELASEVGVFDFGWSE